MDIQHETAGTMEIILNPKESNALAERGFLSVTSGLIKHLSRTTIEIQNNSQEPCAEVSEYGDLNISLPSSPDFPILIHNDQIKSTYDSQRETARRFFGQTGGIILQVERVTPPDYPRH